jgi:LDH2 family malate/lactate/ureidoglycolate dehydrogenase
MDPLFDAKRTGASTGAEVTVPVDELETVVTRVFTAHGADFDVGSRVATSLVLTSLAGIDSHGVLQAIRYVEKIKSGELIPNAKPRLREQKGPVASVDCRRGFGFIGAEFGAQTLNAIAKEEGMGSVTLHDVNHIGRLGEYAELIARAGHVGMVITSGSGYKGLVTPYGGRERAFGTNPISWAIPRGGDKRPIVLDIATSAIASGRAGLAHIKGIPIPENTLLDSEGMPTTDPNALAEGGVLLPFGEYKGSGLMFMIEIMASLFSGFAPSSSSEFRVGNPTVMTAWSVEAFSDRDRFLRLVEETCEVTKNVRPAPGSNEVLLPGERELRTEEERRKDGIPLPASVWNELRELARATPGTPSPAGSTASKSKPAMPGIQGDDPSLSSGVGSGGTGT